MRLYPPAAMGTVGTGLNTNLLLSYVQPCIRGCAHGCVQLPGDTRRWATSPVPPATGAQHQFGNGAAHPLPTLGGPVCNAGAGGLGWTLASSVFAFSCEKACKQLGASLLLIVFKLLITEIPNPLFICKTGVAVILLPT